MTNRPKAIGTAAESAVVKFMRANGFPDAARLTLTGRFDQGDLVLVGSSARPQVIAEVKAHKVFADGDIARWLDETERERTNAKADIALLIVKRPGVGLENVGRWWSIERDPEHQYATWTPVWGAALDLRRAGHGTPLPVSVAF